MSLFQFLLPDIGEGTAEGEIVKWHVKPGDSVSEDQPMVEVMTDKATVVIPSPRNGVVLKLYGKEGDVIPVHTPLVDITVSGSDELPVPVHAQPHLVVESANGLKQPEPVAVNSEPDVVLATPGTRKLARTLGVNLHQIQGSGKHGRITDTDVKKAVSGSPIPVSASETGQPAKPGNQEITEIPFAGIRRKIAERMVQSKYTAPHFTYMDEVDVTELVEIRNRLKPEAEKEGIRLTMMPFIMKAVAEAIKQHPILNSTLNTSRNVIEIRKLVNLGIGMDTQTGLIVPVIRDAGNKTVYKLAADLQDLADRTKKGQVRADELKDSTFTISNVGAIGGLMATPVINFPEVAIMAPGKIQQRPVVLNGEIKIRWMMYHSWSCDHRIVDGADAVKCGNTFAKLLSRPELLLVQLR